MRRARSRGERVVGMAFAVGKAARGSVGRMTQGFVGYGMALWLWRSLLRLAGG